VQLDTDLASFLGGFVAAEGCFTRTGPRFRFAIALGARDIGMCDLAARLLEVGYVRTYPRRRPHYDDEVTFSVQSTRDLVTVVVPFMDESLPPSHKRAQYMRWRTELLSHWEHHARKRRVCTEPGCAEPQLGKGVCRLHYWKLYRK